MSLETINQKLKNYDKISFRKFMLYSFTTALLSVGLVILANPTYLEHYESPIVQLILVIMITMAFTAMYLTLFAGGIVGGIIVTWLLLKSRDSLYVKNGVLIGNSLSTNHEFLRKLGNGLLPKLIGFISSHNDPKFEALENRIEILEENDERKDRHIARQNQEIFALKWVLSRVLRKQQETDKIVNGNALTKNNNENIDFKKFKDIDE